MDRLTFIDTAKFIAVVSNSLVFFMRSITAACCAILFLIVCIPNLLGK